LEVSPDGPDVLPLARICARDFFFTVCEQGRVHTNLTNLAREHRQYLRVGGRLLWAMDVTNCQPLLLGLTLANKNALLEQEMSEYREYLKAANHLHPSIFQPTTHFHLSL
jgi:hypothetical protein